MCTCAKFLFSFQDVYEFPKVLMTSSNIGLKATMPTFHGIVGSRKCLLLVLDWLLSTAGPLRFTLARKIWRQILEGFFGAIFHANNERSKSTLVVRHFLLILAKYTLDLFGKQF